MADLVKLPTELKKNGFKYKQIKRGNHAVIYEQSDPKTGIHAWEVFKIKSIKEKMFLGKVNPAQEIFPGNEAFGRWAWSVGVNTGIEKAYKRFNDLENEGQDDTEVEIEVEDEN